MAAHYCVDYLSHEWASEDLIRTYHETCKQYRRHHVHLITSSVSETEQRKIQREQYKLQRFQNALWREMARHCTNKLSRPNHYINPSTVSWQKESDITWLFGPKFGSDEHLNVKNFSTTLQGLKPILKKNGNVTQSMPACSDRNVKYAWDHPSWSKYTSQSGTIPRKDIGVVRFHPEILEIQYQPDYPVCSPVFPLENDDQDINEELWAFFIQVTLGIKQSAISQILFFTHYIRVPRLFPQLKNEESKELICHQDHVGSLELFILLVSVFKSVFSLTTTWIIYQSLTPFSWITKPLFQSKNAPTTAGQYNKTRLIL